MEPKISVIVPVYNVSAYLPECLDSILHQDYANLEIILIDDGSTDNSGIICDTYATRDSRIVVIHQKNAGAAAAKNVGLRIATGEYLSFVDSDDTLEPGAFRHMTALLENHSADAVQCSFRDVFTDEAIDHIALNDLCTFTTQEYLNRYTADWTCCLLWDKLYKRSLFEGIFFEEGHIVDDEFFTYQGMMNAKKIVHDPTIVYNYRKRRSSVTIRPEYRERTIFDKLDYLEKRRCSIAERFPDLKEIFDLHYLDMLLWLSHDPYVTVKCLETIKSKIHSYLKDNPRMRVDWRRMINLRRVQMTPSDKLFLRRDAEQLIHQEKYFA